MNRIHFDNTFILSPLIHVHPQPYPNKCCKDVLDSLWYAMSSDRSIRSWKENVLYRLLRKVGFIHESFTKIYFQCVPTVSVYPL